MQQIKSEKYTVNRYENNIFMYSRTYQEGGENSGMMIKNKRGSDEKDEHVKEEDKRLGARG